jgi:hypothetical protein
MVDLMPRPAGQTGDQRFSDTEQATFLRQGCEAALLSQGAYNTLTERSYQPCPRRLAIFEGHARTLKTSISRFLFSSVLQDHRHPVEKDDIKEPERSADPAM